MKAATDASKEGYSALFLVMEIPLVVSFLMNLNLWSIRENKDVEDAIAVKDS